MYPLQKHKLSISGKQNTSYKHIIYSQVLTTSFCVSNLFQCTEIGSKLKGWGKGAYLSEILTSKKQRKGKTMFTNPLNCNPWRKEGFNQLFILIIILQGEI